MNKNHDNPLSALKSLPQSLVTLLTKADQDIRRLEPENPYRLYEFLHLTAQRIAPSDAFYVCLYSETDQALFFPYNSEGGLYDYPVTIPLGSGPTSRVIRHCKPVVWSCEAEAIASGSTMFGQMDRFTCSAIHVPIHDHDMQPRKTKSGPPIIGVLSCQAYQPNAYTADTVRAMQWLADRASLALARERDEAAWRYRLRATEALEFERQRPLVALTKEFVSILQTITAQAEALSHLVPENSPALSDAVQRLLTECCQAQTHTNQLPLHPEIAPTVSANTALEQLTPTEHMVLKHISNSKSNRDISQVLFVTEDTVKFHCKNIFQKLNVSSRLAAARLWLTANPPSF